MKIVIQRVTSSQVECEGKVVSSIGRGYMILVGISTADNDLVSFFFLIILFFI
jgi:D-tyrosyl-tRNA(Tyr) deacylase